MVSMMNDWKALGSALRQARIRTELTQTQAASRLGVSRSTVQSIERGTSGKRITPTLRAYIALVESTLDDMQDVLEGRSKVLLPRPDEMVTESLHTASPSASMPMRISEELNRGHLVDTDVIPIGPVDAEAQIVIVVRAGATLTSETRQQVVSAWRTAQKTLRDALSSAS